ncbi:MAG: hypothetical protein E7115_01890 [Bacteroidales bacterium]|nr:hypothetical protein [Bacteroidales bacterium]
MKLNIKYLSFLLAGAVALASCDKNEPNVFDDKDAFVAFDAVSVTYAEDYSKDGATFKIPVTLASVKGLEETVKFEVVTPEEKGAVADVNYKLLSTTGVLSFDAEHRTQYIEFETMTDGEYTGDLKFIVKLLPTETLPVGSESECTVTISDIDHPLTFMLGEYTAASTDFFSGAPTSWTMTIYKDAEDDHKVWIDNIFNNAGWAADDTRFYGIVSDDNTTLNIPFGQESEYKYQGTTPVVLLGLTAEGNGADTGSVDVKIVVDGSNVTLDFGKEWGFWANIDGAGWIGLVAPGMTAVKN